jgi:hypothetical protein
MRLIPQADLIVLLPPGEDRLVLRPFKMAAALADSGVDYLYVDPAPPPPIRKGQTYTHKFVAHSKMGGADFSLTGRRPDGMTITPDGELRWEAPAVFGDYFMVCKIVLKDKAGRRVEHLCAIPVE